MCGNGDITVVSHGFFAGVGMNSKWKMLQHTEHMGIPR